MSIFCTIFKEIYFVQTVGLTKLVNARIILSRKFGDFYENKFVILDL